MYETYTGILNYTLCAYANCIELTMNKIVLGHLSHSYAHAHTRVFNTNFAKLTNGSHPSSNALRKTPQKGFLIIISKMVKK